MAEKRSALIEKTISHDFFIDMKRAFYCKSWGNATAEARPI